MPNIVDKFTVRYWNGSFYASVRFENGSTQELKSDKDLTFAGWQDVISAAWNAMQNLPKPVEAVSLEAATKEQIAARAKELGLTAKDLGF